MRPLKLFRVVLIILLLVGGLGLSQQSSIQRHLLAYQISDWFSNSSVSILTLGSSSAFLFAKTLQSTCGSSLNRAIPASTMTHTLSFLAHSTRWKSAKSAIVYVGENDIVRGHAPLQWKSDLYRLVSLLESSEAIKNIFWVTVKLSPKRESYWPQFNDFNQELLFATEHSEKIHLIQHPLQNTVIHVAYSADGLHLSEYGNSISFGQINYDCSN